MRILLVLVLACTLAASDAPPTRRDLFEQGQVVQSSIKDLLAAAQTWEKHCIKIKLPTTGCYWQDLSTAVYPPDDKGLGTILNADLIATAKKAREACAKYNSIHGALHIAGSQEPALGIDGEIDQPISELTLLEHLIKRSKAPAH